jgi:hypothetical protein
MDIPVEEGALLIDPAKPLHSVSAHIHLISQKVILHARIIVESDTRHVILQQQLCYMIDCYLAQGLLLEV